MGFLAEIFMKTLFFDDIIDKESVTDLIESIEEVEDDNIKIYFQSEGGGHDYMQVLSDYVNTHKDKTFHFIVNWHVGSAAFDLFLDLKCKKSILDGAYAMTHLYNRMINTSDTSDENEHLLQNLNDTNKRLLDKVKPYLTEDEFTKLKNKEDIYINTERLRLIVS